MEPLLKFYSIAEKWLDEKKKLVKHSTYCAYLLTVKIHLLPEFSSRAEISEEDARKFVYSKLASGLSRKTVHDILAILKAIMKFAAKHCGISAYEWDIPFPAVTESKPLKVLCVSDHRKLLTRVRDNTSSNGWSAKSHKLSGDPAGSPDFLTVAVYCQRTSCPLECGTS